MNGEPAEFRIEREQHMAALGRKGTKTASWGDGRFRPESRTSPDPFFSTIMFTIRSRLQTAAFGTDWRAAFGYKRKLNLG